MTIGEKIYKIRNEMGLTQKEFAKIAGVSQSAINFWENGKRQPRLEQLNKLASALNIPISTFIDEHLVEDIAENITEIIKELNSAGKELVETTTNAIENVTVQLIELGEELMMKKVMENFSKLNAEGQVKLYDYSEDMIANPKYCKHTPEQPLQE